ncbi:MAG: hypothetical protein IT360_16225 [Gemmatimonadaceae bacterium]|nr:hypothetical protein [Gemmatimonadaceae bacterium]
MTRSSKGGGGKQGRGAPPPTHAPPPSRNGGGASTVLTAARRRTYLLITLLLPLLLLAGVEGTLRLARPAGGLPLFIPAAVETDGYLVANPEVGRRWFAGVASAPAPPAEFFARQKPANGFRLFVLGESTTAGFPFPRNGTFSRELRDALRDVLPRDSVEVINLGIAATNSVTMRDLASEVADADPDAVLIYAGHNEYYGVLGAASARGGPLAPYLVRATLALQRLRLGLALRALLEREGGAATDSAPSFMEILARDREVPLSSTTFARGEAQFVDNLSALLATFRARGIPVFVGSPVSNVRDRPPFASPDNKAADSVFRDGLAALARADSARARDALPLARDLDVVRFRAPSRFVGIVQEAAAVGGAAYVPVAERFEAASAGLPGASLFLEHVHPTRAGVTVLARAFYDALAEASFLGHAASPERLKSWDEYERGTTLTPFDERVAFHTVQTLAERWPFVPIAEQRDYRATYRPEGLADSLAFLVSRGGVRWEAAKVQLGLDFERRSLPDSALAEYAGLVRDQPLAELPRRLMAQALQRAGATDSAEHVMRAALRVEPTSAAALALGRLLIDRNDVAGAIPLLEQAVSLEPRNTTALYQLSLAYGLARDIARARATALALARIDPRFPGLGGWMEAIGLAR